MANDDVDTVKPGGEVEAWCTSCRDMKWHVIVAVVDNKPAKVECHGCHKQHQFKAQPPGAAKPKASRAPKPQAVPPPTAPPTDLEEKLRAGEASAKTYSPRETYAVGDILRHPQFGVGLVVALPAAQKLELAFRDGRKLLVHDRSGGAPPPTLQRPPRVDEDKLPRYASDAPPPKPTED